MIGYLFFFFLFSVLAVFWFNILYVGIVVVVFLESKWYSILITVANLLTALYLGICNYVLVNDLIDIMDFEDWVFFGIGLTFMTLLCTLIRIWSLKYKLIGFLLIVINQILLYYPFKVLFDMYMSV